MRQLSTAGVRGTTNTTIVDLSDDLTLKTIASYRDLEASKDVDLDASLVPGLQTSKQRTEPEHSTLEIQLPGNALDNKLEWVTGLYWYYEDGVEHSPGDVFQGVNPEPPSFSPRNLPLEFRSQSGRAADRAVALDHYRDAARLPTPWLQRSRKLSAQIQGKVVGRRRFLIRAKACAIIYVWTY